MSSILNALKKLEKDRKKTQGDLSGLSPAVLYGQNGNAQRMKRLFRGVLIFICGGAAVYAFLHRTAPENNRIPAPPPISTDARPLSAGGPSLVPAPAGTQIPAEGTPPAATAPLPSAAESVTVIPERRVKLPSGPAQSSSPPAMVSPVVPLPVPVAPAEKRKKPELVVHGIAFQEDGRSIAVVNGTPVQAGTVIDGAIIVDEISKDRVHFRQGQETFDVLLDRNGQ